MKKLFLFMALLCLCFEQNTTAQVKSLKVGDKFPDIEFDKLIRYSKSKLKISDFKGKLVILDFWSPDCGSCIHEMPEMGKLQKQFGDKIRILPIWSSSGRSILKWGVEKRDRLGDSLWNNNPSLFNASKLPTILDTLLNPYVKGLPLAGLKIWIDGKGIVRAMTDPEYVNEKEISKMLKGNFPKWRTWKIIGYNTDIPLIDTNSNQYKFSKTNYAVFEKYKDSYGPRTEYQVDSIKATKRVILINNPILTLYSSSYKKFIDVPSWSRIIVENKNKNKFYKDDYWQEWQSRNTYCFEKVMPINVSDEQFAKSMISELDGYLKIKSSIELRKTKCLVLKVINPGLFAKTIKEDKDGFYGTLNTAFIFPLSGNLLPELEIPMIFDPKLQKTYQDKKFEDFRLPQNRDLGSINAALKLRGLELVESFETIPMIILKDRDNSK